MDFQYMRKAKKYTTVIAIVVCAGSTSRNSATRVGSLAVFT